MMWTYSYFWVTDSNGNWIRNGGMWVIRLESVRR